MCEIIWLFCGVEWYLLWIPQCWGRIRHVLCVQSQRVRRFPVDLSLCEKCAVRGGREGGRGRKEVGRNGRRVGGRGRHQKKEIGREEKSRGERERNGGWWRKGRKNEMKRRGKRGGEKAEWERNRVKEGRENGSWRKWDKLINPQTPVQVHAQEMVLMLGNTNYAHIWSLLQGAGLISTKERQGHCSALLVTQLKWLQSFTVPRKLCPHNEVIFEQATS